MLLLSLLHNPVVTSCIVKASPPGPHAILIQKKKRAPKTTSTNSKARSSTKPLPFTSGVSLYNGMEKCNIQNEEENQAYVSQQQQTSQRTVISEAL